MKPNTYLFIYKTRYTAFDKGDLEYDKAKLSALEVLDGIEHALEIDWDKQDITWRD